MGGIHSTDRRDQKVIQNVNKKSEANKLRRGEGGIKQIK